MGHDGNGRVDGAGARPSGRRPWHAATVSEALDRLSSLAEGLSSADAERRLAEYGLNTLTRRCGPSGWSVMARQFTSPLISSATTSSATAT